MERLKKIGFFVVFFFTLFQVLGVTAMQLNDNPILIENSVNDLSDCELNFYDSEEQDDEYSLISLVPFISVLRVKENIPMNKYCIDLLFDINFWQPPQNILIWF